MRYYPVFLDLADRPVIIVGGGVVARRKLALLVSAGARVTLIAPDFSDALCEQAGSAGATVLKRRFAAGDIAGAAFAIAATDDAAVNAAVAAEARQLNIPVNVVDDANLSTAVLPAVIDRDPLVVAVGTAGNAPVLARRVRERIEALLAPSLGTLARFAAQWRSRIRDAIPPLPARRRFWEWLIDGPAAQALARGRHQEAHALVEHALARGATGGARGQVALVGAGPGDPGLLTLRALRVLQDADIVFHDRLVSDEVLELVRRDAERVDVGKRGGGHATDQASIHAQLLAAARRGLRVVRLKGGDPLTFARGGEELEFLRAHEIPFEVVPGVTAATAAAAYAAIPLTHRDLAQSVRFVTAHCATSLAKLDWKALVAPGQTLAVYMGVSTLDAFSTELVIAGLDPATPVALVENASRPEQRVVIGRIGSIARLAQTHAVKAPALLVVGKVAALGEALSWFGDRPLGEVRAEAPAPVAAASASREVGMNAAGDEAAPLALYAY